ncbi:uncharacterized protein LOC119384028 isoform X2 [Rhipicephalus sanguineus]|uniref:uncharacterized protein LOC119384028 isoform X2 n=1 Tax=Rhipicephalus sanguineus TaxID=34632 RepID=UPI001896223A|nr:uncharacterized protein LOC119384028 isoform X2 [Rhipicephalus sanguineus]
MIVISFAGLLVSNVVVRVVGESSCSHSSDIDGWTFFSKSSRFDMLLRNYNHSGRLNHSMCVNIRRNNSAMGDHEVTKNFTYLNLTSKFDKWATALIKLKFYTEIVEYDEYEYNGETSTTPISKQTYMYAKSTIVCNCSGSREPSPEDSSRGEDDDTATRKYCLKRRCELWVRRLYNESQRSHGELSDSHCCEKFFNRTCAVSTLVRVYDPDICIH